MELDIRNGKNGKIDVIRFADGGEGYAAAIKELTCGNDYGVRILNSHGSETTYIRMEDIDMFIAALKEAKERWE